jgi:hypothetical protein
MTTEGLKEGYTVYLVTDNFEIKEARFYSHCYDEDIWVVFSEHWGTTDHENSCFLRQSNQWRPTYREALDLRLKKLSQRKQQLSLEMNGIDEEIANVINELNSEKL